MIPEQDLDKLVSTITETVLKEVDDVLSEVSGKPTSSPASQPDGDYDSEQVLWEGRPFLSLSVHYTITSERVRISEGLLGKTRNDIELIRIQDMDYTQSATERMANIGDIHIHSHDPNSPEVVLQNVSSPGEVHEILRRAVMNARKRHNLSFREEM